MPDSHSSRIAPSPPPLHRLAYLPEIDGLRAIAILWVLLFHFEIPGFRGGFTGVDVFFVISGFLISKGIQSDLDKDVFSVALYYIRRAKRIYPALLAMLLFTLAAGLALLLPFDFIALAKSASMAAYGVSNFYFSRVADNYFAGDVNQMPLLHTWSLGVEEQFYIALPLMQWGLHRFIKNKALIRICFATLLLASLGLSQAMLANHQAQAFYGLPSRAWELLAGTFLAHLPFPKSAGIQSLCSAAGLFFLFLGTFTLNPNSPFPGFSALLPVGGATLVLLGQGAGGGRWLAFPALRGIGKMSYSLYLWHWPILTLAAITAANGSSEFLNHGLASLLLSKFGLISLTFGLAFLSWKYIETPFRTLGGKAALRLAIFSVLLIFSIAYFSRYIRKNDGFLLQPSSEIREILAYKKDENPHLRKAFDKHVPPENAFVYGDTTVAPTFVLWGDSHANAIAYALGEVASEYQVGVRFYGRGGTKPLPSLYEDATGPSKIRKEYTQKAYQLIREDPLIHTVLLCARWMGPTKRDLLSPRELSGPSQIPKVSSGGEDVALDVFLQKHVGALVEELNQAGKRVVLIYPIPEVGIDVPQLVAAQALHPQRPFNTPNLHRFLSLQAPIFRAFNDLPAQPGLIRMQPHPFFSDGVRLTYADAQRPLYQDDHHLNLTGSRRLRPLFEQILSGTAVDTVFPIPPP
jgi:peptidoglycan/LPS O-acetylase OafA/YrhL